MLKEWFAHLTTRCSARARAMGYLREHIAIDARLRRHGAAWAGHLACSRAAVLAAADRCQRHRTVVILGGGLLNDVPLPELHRRFQRVVLVDVLHRPAHRERVRRLAPGAVCQEWDVTGALDRLGDGRLDDAAAIACFAQSDPGAIPDAVGIDLLVSLNLCSQLAVQPAAWLARRRRRGPDFAAALAAAATTAHVAWLQRQPGHRLLVTDLRWEMRTPEGRIVDSQPVAGLDGVGEPERSWDWRIAPAPEVHRQHDLVHRVGAFAFPNRVIEPATGVHRVLTR